MVEKTQETQGENENAELAMREQCTKHGEFKKNENGMLEFNDYLVLRGIIARQSARMFKPKRDECDKKKLEAFKSGNDAEYVKAFRESRHTQEQCSLVMMSKTCQYINIKGQEYGIASRAYMSDQAK